MPNCPPLIDAAFVQQATGADISDLERVDTLISITSDMVSEELVGNYSCIDPDQAPMRLKIVVAEFVAQNLVTRPTDQVVKAETVGDYRVEYAQPFKSGLDLQTLHKMLAPFRRRYYTVQTMPDLTNSWDERVYATVGRLK